jgi:PKD repeat protein
MEESMAGQGGASPDTGDPGQPVIPPPGEGVPGRQGPVHTRTALAVIIVVIIGVLGFMVLPPLLEGSGSPGPVTQPPLPTWTATPVAGLTIHPTPAYTPRPLNTGMATTFTLQTRAGTRTPGGEVVITSSNSLAPGFSAAPESGPMPLSVTFTDQSAGSPEAWSWDFGDGTTSPVRNPVHTYTSPGTYSVTLKVMYSDSSRSTRKTDLIHVIATGWLPEAMFSAEPRNGTPPLTVRFTDQSAGSPETWSWEFGDGFSSTDRDPQHVYTTPGSYTVNLAVENRFGRDSVTETGYVRVKAAGPGTHATVTSRMTPTYQGTAVRLPTSDDLYGTVAPDQQKPVARFSFDPAYGPLPLTVRFTDESTGSPDRWSWDFGDGSTSTLKNPVHTYNEPAENPYIVRLTVSNVQGTSTTGSDTGIEVFYRM